MLRAKNYLRRFFFFSGKHFSFSSCFQRPLEIIVKFILQNGSKIWHRDEKLTKILSQFYMYLFVSFPTIKRLFSLVWGTTFSLPEVNLGKSTLLKMIWVLITFNLLFRTTGRSIIT